MEKDAENPPENPPKRWSAKKKSQVVLRLLGGESIDKVSREVVMPTYTLEEWRIQAVEGIEASLTAHHNHPLSGELDQAKRKIGELSMENELLWERCRKKSPLFLGRSKR